MVKAKAGKENNMMTLEQIIEKEQTKRTEGGQFGIAACKECIQFYLDHGQSLEQLLEEYVERANEDVFFNKAMVLACWEMIQAKKEEEKAKEGTMKYADINKRYTEIVAEYIGKGYSINTISMNGSQGETAKIDLTNGTEIIRIMVDTFSDWSANVEGVEIIVGRVIDPDVKPHDNSGWHTIWNNRLETLACERFYKIGRDGNCYGTEAEALAAKQKRYDRYIRRNGGNSKNVITNPRAIQLAKDYILRKNIAKRVSLDNLSVYKTIDRHGNLKYTISYKDTAYCLH